MPEVQTANPNWAMIVRFLNQYRMWFRSACLILAIFLPILVVAGDFHEGKVVRIVDGDTLVLLVFQ